MSFQLVVESSVEPIPDDANELRAAAESLMSFPTSPCIGVTAASMALVDDDEAAAASARAAAIDEWLHDESMNDDPSSSFFLARVTASEQIGTRVAAASSMNGNAHDGVDGCSGQLDFDWVASASRQHAAKARHPWLSPAACAKSVEPPANAVASPMSPFTAVEFGSLADPRSPLRPSPPASSHSAIPGTSHGRLHSSRPTFSNASRSPATSSPGSVTFAANEITAPSTPLAPKPGHQQQPGRVGSEPSSTQSPSTQGSPETGREGHKTQTESQRPHHHGHHEGTAPITTVSPKPHGAALHLQRTINVSPSVTHNSNGDPHRQPHPPARSPPLNPHAPSAFSQLSGSHRSSTSTESDDACNRRPPRHIQGSSPQTHHSISPQRSPRSPCAMPQNPAPHVGLVQAAQNATNDYFSRGQHRQVHAPSGSPKTPTSSPPHLCAPRADLTTSPQASKSPSTQPSIKLEIQLPDGVTHRETPEKSTPTKALHHRPHHSIIGQAPKQHLPHSSANATHTPTLSGRPPRSPHIRPAHPHVRGGTEAEGSGPKKLSDDHGGGPVGTKHPHEHQ